MLVLEKDDHLLKAKLTLKSVDIFTDEQAEKVFLETDVTSVDDIGVLVDYLKQCRPKLYVKEIKILNGSSRRGTVFYFVIFIIYQRPMEEIF